MCKAFHFTWFIHGNPGVKHSSSLHSSCVRHSVSLHSSCVKYTVSPHSSCVKHSVSLHSSFHFTPCITCKAFSFTPFIMCKAFRFTPFIMFKSFRFTPFIMNRVKQKASHLGYLGCIHLCLLLVLCSICLLHHIAAVIIWVSSNFICGCNLSRNVWHIHYVSNSDYQNIYNSDTT